MDYGSYWERPNIEREFEESGLRCFTRAVPMGHRCGYVAVEYGHPLYGRGYDEAYDLYPRIAVDGGITFAGEIDGSWVFGWDAAHAWHLKDLSIMSDEYRGFYGTDLGNLHYPFWEPYMVDADMAEMETRRFARQLAAIGGAE